MLALLLGACSNRFRRDFGGGEAPRVSNAVTATVWNDVASVEMALAEGSIPFDVRDYNAWAQGRVPGARLISIDDINNGLGLPEDPAVPILFIGQGPLDDRPDRAAQAAIDRGHVNVQVFPGGWDLWVSGRTVR